MQSSDDAHGNADGAKAAGEEFVVARRVADADVEVDAVAEAAHQIKDMHLCAARFSARNQHEHLHACARPGWARSEARAGSDVTGMVRREVCHTSGTARAVPTGFDSFRDADSGAHPGGIRPRYARRPMAPLSNLADQVRAWRAAAPGFVERQAKNLGHLRYGWGHEKQVSFVFGCQRSGTKMLMRILDESPAVRIYHENHATAFHDFQLRSDRTVRLLARTSPAPSPIFKPICDSQRADQILASFPEAHGLWTYRHYDDVANSACQKWGAHQREIVSDVIAGDAAKWGWRTERLPEDVVAAIRRVARPDLSDFEGALLFWYMRNAFFFALGLDAHPRMLLTRYEDLVTEPEAAFERVYRHVGAPLDHRFLGRVHSEGVRRREPPPASPEIRALCADLLARLDACNDRARATEHGRTPVAEPALVSPVLILINTLGVGGAERYVVTVANWLAARGVKVVVASEAGSLVPDLAANVTFVDAPLYRVRADLLSVADTVGALIDAHQPAAIVANSLAVTWVARAALLRRPAIPIIAIGHGWPDDRYRLVGPLMRAADTVVAVSPEVRAKLVAGGLAPARCVVIYNGVDCRGLGVRPGPVRAATRAALGVGPDDVLVITLGRLTPQKAHQHVITIAEQLKAGHPNLKYAIVGEGGRAEELAGLVASHGVGDCVLLPGVRSDVGDLLGSADIYLSCSDWEGMPLSTIEAMASELPTVATRTEGSGQLLTDACGIVVPVGDAAAMAAAIARLAADAPLRVLMGQAARERALASFSHDRMVGELATVMAGVVDSLGNT